MNPSPPIAELAKHYDPKEVEPKLYERWERSGYFHEEPDPARPPFIICMPPPNVTGPAHLGHGSTFTPMDVLTRYHRMLGDNADWIPGLDHAAIATEAVLVKALAAEGLTRDGLGRTAYLERAWDWTREYGGTINKQFRALGFGPDWARQRFTMDDGLSRTVRKVFVELYRQGLIYRGKRLINWDPKGQTTVSDAEVDHVERDAHLWHVAYPLLSERYDPARPPGKADFDATHTVVVATTRPETMVGDVAIAVHPDDERYARLVGRRVALPPLFERSIPIIADASVERTFGTGAVKVTPAHDAADYDIGLRHRLPMPSIMDLQARITSADVPVGKYAGLDRYAARKRILEDLREAGALLKEEPHRHAVSISERSGDVIEPLLSEQWFLTMKPLAAPALEAYRDGRLRFVPERYGRTYEQWLENIRDWNVSRQVWWGHQLPVWYAPDGAPVVAETEEEARAIALRDHGTDRLTRDPDTLDTWFSSGLWPFSILGWPEPTPEMACWYPSQVLITGWEIIFLWVARMVMLGLHFTGKVPFPVVFIAPLVFDAKGRKMSKSLGNAIDPMDLVERFGADAFRMGMLRQMRLEGQEIRFQETRCEEARNFNTKIWNATRYMLTLPEGLPPAMTLPKAAELRLADRWILTRLHDTIVTVGGLLDACDFGNVAETVWKFVWYEFCDWYLEATKEPAPSRAPVLSFVWNAAMRLLHPLCPFISEEVWLALPHDGQTIMTAAWPDALEVPVDRPAAERFEQVRTCVDRLRALRAEIGLSPRTQLMLEIPKNVPDDVTQLLAAYVNGTAEPVAERGSSLQESLAAVRARAPRDVVLEHHRKELARLSTEVQRGERKLANQSFVRNAKPEVVALEREKLERYRDELARASAALASMGSEDGNV